MSDFVRKILKEVFDQDKIDAFYEKNNIDPNVLHYLGKGHFGKAYSIGDGRVLKITSSPEEYEIAKHLIGKHFEGLVEYFAAEQIDTRSFYIIEEEAEFDPSIEDMYFTLYDISENDGGGSMREPLQINIKKYEKDNNLKTYLSEFAQELQIVLNGYRRAGVENGDIGPDNLGRNKKGKLVAFDIDGRL